MPVNLWMGAQRLYRNSDIEFDYVYVIRGATYVFRPRST
jgi:hypothetical protein